MVKTLLYEQLDTGGNNKIKKQCLILKVSFLDKYKKNLILISWENKNRHTCLKIRLHSSVSDFLWKVETDIHS